VSFDFGYEGMDTAPPSRRRLGTTNSFARVLYWHYNRQNFKNPTQTKALGAESDSVVLNVKSGVLEKEIVELRTSKSIRQASGTFDITLLPTVNWKQKLAPGDWVVVYLFKTAAEAGAFDPNNPSNKNIIMLGNIDRVARSKQRDEQTDKITVRYNVSGRDFGKVFDETNVWFDPYTPQGFLLKKFDGLLVTQGLGFKGNPSELCNSFLDIFIGPNGADLSKTGLGRTRTDSLEQWRIPQEMKSLFADPLSASGFNELKYPRPEGPDVPEPEVGFIGTGPNEFSSSWLDEILVRKIESDLPGYRFRSQLVPGSSGGIWGPIKENSNKLTNDVFLDMTRTSAGHAQPSITLRPRPCSIFFEDPTGKLNGKTNTLQDLAYDEAIKMDPANIKFENLGKDGQTRFNMIWLDPVQSKKKEINSYAHMANSKPLTQAESVRRHGLKRLHQQLHFVYAQGGTQSGLDVNINLFKSFAHLVYDLHAYNHLYDTGSMTTVGEGKAELGKVLKVPTDVEFSSPRIYYVEGYQHHWTFPGQWETEWSLTMGQFDHLGAPFIDLIDEDDGTFDDETANTSLVKTNVTRPSGPGRQSEKKWWRF